MINAACNGSFAHLVSRNWHIRDCTSASTWLTTADLLDGWLVGSYLSRTIYLRSNRRVVLIVMIKDFRALMIKITAAMRVPRDHKSCVRPVAVLPNAEEGFRSFLMSLRNFEGMWEDGTAQRSAVPSLASTDNFQRRRCKIHQLRRPSE